MGIRLAKDPAAQLPTPRSLDEILAGLSPAPPFPMQTRGRLSTDGPVPSSPGVTTPINMGGDTAGLSRLGVLLAQRKALQDAPLGSQVNRTPTGWDVTPPDATPNRWMKGLGTALQAVAMSGAKDPWEALGAAGTGFAAGTISPNLADAFTRSIDLNRNAGEVAGEAAIDLGNSKITDLLAQAEYNRARPTIELSRILQQQQEAADRIAAQDRATNQRGTAASQASRDRQAGVAATREYNQSQIKQREAEEAGRSRRAGESLSVSREGNAIRREGNQIRREEVGQRGERAAAQAQALYDQASKLWGEAQQKRAAAKTTRGDAKDQLLREAERLETKTINLQTEGDKLRAGANAGGSAPSTSSPPSKTFDLRRWKADHPGQDPAGVIQRAQSQNLRIIE